MTYWIPLSIALVVGTYSTLLINRMRTEEKTNQLMQHSLKMMYATCNIVLFLAV